MARRRESGVPLMEYDQGAWRHAGQEETGGAGHNRPSMMPAVWTVASLLAVLGVAAALAVSVIAFRRIEHHSEVQTVDRLCNRGENTGLGLEDCPDVAGVPGFPLVSASAGEPGTVYVSRVSRGDGVLVTETGESHIEVSALVESLTPALVVGVSPSPARAITLDIDLPAINVTLCNITCEQNFFVHLLNGASGYGLAMGTDHTFPDDATHMASAILSGRQNTLIASGGSVVVGGRNNTISDTFCSMIGAGLNNTVLSPRSGIVIGEFNYVNSSHSFIGSGQLNVIDSLYEANAIVSGDSNEVLNGTRSIIGAGFDNVMRDSDDCAIVSGKENQILDSVTSIIGAGTDSLIDNSVASSILSGTNNTVAGSSHSTIGGGESNLVNNTIGAVISAGYDNTIHGDSFHSGIFTGYQCIVDASNASMIGAGTSIAMTSCIGCFAGAGTSNTLTSSTNSALVAGTGNLIANATQALIGAGLSNTISSLTANTQNAIVVGDENTISGSNIGFIGTGFSNDILDSVRCGIGAGANNDVDFATSAFIVAGEDNWIDNVTIGFIGAADSCRVADSSNSGIMTGFGNLIENARNSAIVGGSSNIISGDGILVGIGIGNFIGAGYFNEIRSTDGTLTEGNLIGAGTNTILDSVNTCVVAGNNNLIDVSDSCGVVAGMDNTITNQEYAFIGAGELNTITAPTAGSTNVIVAGFTNLISGDINRAYIGVAANSVIRNLDSVPQPTSDAMIGAGFDNIITDSLRVSIGVGRSARITDSRDSSIVNGNFSSIVGSNGAFIGTSIESEIETCEGAAILGGANHSITSADYASIISGRDIQIAGALNEGTAFARHLDVLETFRTPAIRTITADTTVVLGDHLFLVNGVTAALNLGDSTTTPDGMQVRVRDLDGSGTTLTVSCVVSGCTICPPGGACALGGTDAFVGTFSTRFYVFDAAAESWYAY